MIIIDVQHLIIIFILKYYIINNNMCVLILFQGEYCTVFDIVHHCQSTHNHSYNVYFPF